ncbi:AAA family ATPase [Burkholderia gladioli]|uniref:AAA family ATPase n=1 Tax=Burkholderia gladioli TaxID=28095 RepID=UPI00202DE4CF|nr:AAA family ATPase [Burkholderia gladioli]URV26498.1 AAA family ATPase [Burkholderia gladioli]
MKFSKLTLTEWRQFAKVDLALHPRMTIITGANGAGKTTLLKLLAQHFGWNMPLLATPKKKPGASAFRYASGLMRKFFGNVEQPVPSQQVGAIEYDDGSSALLFVPDNGAASYIVEIRGQKQINGVSINSHRPIQNYQPIGAIPTSAINAEQAYQAYFGELMQRYNNGYTQYSPIYRMKETLISMAMFGAGNQYVEKNESLERLFLNFKNILSEILPPSIGFLDISVRIPDVVLVTRSGEFMIDAASGGLMSLIDLGWQIFLYSHDKKDFTVLLDEPENHLHPSMQRSLLNRLSSAFPHAQFIVATHSPFMVSSVKDSIVHALKYESADGSIEAAEFSASRVSSVELDLDTRAATANEILRDVLGVPITLPQWAEEDLQRITSQLDIRKITPEGLIDLRERLSAVGLSEYYPEALKMAADR